jgi:hypothetical protein
MIAAVVLSLIGAFMFWLSFGGYNTFLPGHGMKDAEVKKDRDEAKKYFWGIFFFFLFIAIIAIG